MLLNTLYICVKEQTFLTNGKYLKTHLTEPYNSILSAKPPNSTPAPLRAAQAAKQRDNNRAAWLAAATLQTTAPRCRHTAPGACCL